MPPVAAATDVPPASDDVAPDAPPLWPHPQLPAAWITAATRLVPSGLAPRPVQVEAWLAIASGADVAVVAPTGMGKTLAFTLPLLAGRDILRGYTLIFAPIRELIFGMCESLQDQLLMLGNGAPFTARCVTTRTHPAR